MKKYVNLFVSVFMIGVCLSQGRAQAKSAVSYKNPVVDTAMPSPMVIRATDGYFYVYATESTRNVPIMESKNLMEWMYYNTVLTNKARPRFEPKAGIWVPDINYINSRYVLHYATSVWGEEQTCGTKVATANSPQGPFMDYGRMFRSNEIGVQNSIDPSLLRYERRNYLVWGSFRGIYVIELITDGLPIMSGVKKKRIAGTTFEAVYIHKHGDYYYMSISIGSYCQGVRSTYKVVVGRSKKVWGPYKDKTGKPMSKNGYSLVIGADDHFVDSGHDSQIIQDDAGQDWLLYHGFSRPTPENGRILLLDQIKWDQEGWPYVEGGSPSHETQKASVFNN